MKAKILASPLTVVVLLAGVPVLAGAQSSAPPPNQAVYMKTVQPVIAKYCYGCHNDKLRTADLSLESLRDPATAIKQTGTWEHVLDRLNTGKMPPAGLPAPDKTETAAIVTWIRDLTGKSSASALLPDGSPGRVTARRLNRVEYTNTVRDLLGVHTEVASEFPVDDAGYGFDNIGDVLTISPLLMEKYMAAARKISRLAVFGEPLPAQPTRLAEMLPKKGPELLAAPGNGIILPYSMRGAMYGTWVAPVDAEYEFRVKVINHRDAGIDYNGPLEKFLSELKTAMNGPSFQEGALPNGGGGGGGGRGPGRAGRGGRGPRAPLTPEEMKARVEKDRLAFPPVRMSLVFDGKQILEGFIEGNTNYQYDRGAFIARIPVKAGEHTFRASFPKMADFDDPRRNINPDGRRRMYIESMDIAGPYNPSSAPLESQKKIFVCGSAGVQKHSAACASMIVRNLLEHAYRRPVAQQEVSEMAGLIALAQRQGDSFEEGVRLVVESILMSPDFLFRTEKDAPAAPVAAHRISDYELASRLSYFLWSSMPDDELFRLAKQQTLHQPVVLDAQLRRMMADPKASALVDNFAGQWLGIRNLDRRPPDPDKFPTTDDEILDYMRHETNLFVSAIIHEDRSVLDFIDAPFTYLNGPLAAHYGIPGVKGEEFRKVSLEGTPRSGILTQGAVLIVSAYPTRTSVVTRGKWVLENLLGTPPPPPPPDVPSLKESDIGSSATLREKMEQHRADPKCAVCHVQMDPIGFSLENYDASGAWRTHDGKFPIDASGQLPDGRKFEGAQGLEKTLKAQSNLFARNLTEKMMTYALGRGLEPYDKTAVDQICRDLEGHQYRFSRLVADVIQSRAFQMRSADPTVAAKEKQ